MRVSVEPQRIELDGHRPFTIMASVTNTADVIGGYHLRVLGADPSWVSMGAENLSLFPDTSQTVAITVTIPPGVGSGDRRIAIQVQEVTPPHAISVVEVELAVPALESMRMALSPMTVICGRRGRFSVIAENTGNTPASVRPIGLDPEAKIAFEFVPAVLDLAPGEHVITDLRATAKRRWFGSPVVRQFGLAALPADAPDPWPPPERAAGQPEAGEATEAGELDAPEPPPDPPEALAQGTMMQKPRLGRGVLSLLSLLLAVTVFAVVITIAMSRLAGASAADRDLALQIASARTSGGAAGSSVLGGTAKLLTDGSPASGVTVELFDAGNLTQPIVSTATDKAGAWSVVALPAGSYKVRFRGAGFVEVWYPNALTGADAKAVQLDAGQKLTKVDVTLGGLPASITGQVMGADVAGGILTVQVPTEYLKQQAPVAASRTAGGTVTAQPVPTTGAAQAAVSATSPPGLRAPGAPARVEPGAGAAAPTGSPGGPAGSAGTPAGTASPGGASPGGAASGASPPPGAVLRTVPLSSDGTFALADLPSPAVYDLVVSKTGYATDTQRIDLSGGESRTGVILLLRSGDGLIQGTVVGPDGPLGNAVITATDGSTSLKTISLTKGAVGQYTLRGLVTPATYTVTVSLPGYTTVTATLALASAQQLTGVLTTLSKAAGSLSGTVTTLSDNKPASGVTVTITSGSSTKLDTVTQSGAHAGTWTVANLPIPGTYTVTFSRSDLQSQTVAVALDASGRLTSGAGSSGGIDVAMRSAYGVVQGTVTQQRGRGTGTVPVGEATISLTSGTQSYTITSASTPLPELGVYRVGHVEPGTYTLSASSKGTSPTTVIITVTAGQVLTYDPVLIPPASISGIVTDNGVPLPGTEVDLYLSSNYPTTKYRSTVTAADGHYSFTGVDAPQAYVVEARNATTGPLVSGTIVLAASQAGVLNLEAAAADSSAVAPSTSSSATGPTTSATPTQSTGPTGPTGSTGSTAPPKQPAQPGSRDAGPADATATSPASSVTHPPASGVTP